MSGAILFYISSHGFGHVTRAIVLVEAMRRRGVPVTARTYSGLAWLFEQRGLPMSPSRGPVDLGMVQPSAMDIDLEKTLAHHLALGAEWEARVDEEALVIRQSGARLVAGDIPPLAFAAAKRAGVPSAAVGNFSWDWIFAYYAAKDERFQPIAERYAQAYASATTLFRLPLSCPMPAFASVVEAPLLVRRSAQDRAAARRLVGIPEQDDRPLILVSFGGVKGLETDMRRSEDLTDFLCVGFEDRPRGLKTDWIHIPTRSKLEHVDVMAACDAVIGKPGYGTCAEALAHRRPFLYVPRPDYPENAALVDGMTRLGVAAPLSREDFQAGRWRPALEALLEAPAHWADLPLDGAEFIALRLGELVE